MQVDLQVEVPKGYELTGEYRAPAIKEHFLNTNGDAEMCYREYDVARLILRKVDTWRDATLDDLKRVTDGETVECKVWDDTRWRGGFTLRGWQAYGDRHQTWYVWNSNGYGYYYKRVQVK